MVQDKEFIYEALLSAIQHSIEEGEGVIVTVRDHKSIVANIGGSASIIPLTEIIDNPDDYSDGQWITINTEDDAE